MDDKFLKFLILSNAISSLQLLPLDTLDIRLQELVCKETCHPLLVVGGCKRPGPLMNLINIASISFSKKLVVV